jgi:hypothetical protein
VRGRLRSLRMVCCVVALGAIPCTGQLAATSTLLQLVSPVGLFETAVLHLPWLYHVSQHSGLSAVGLVSSTGLTQQQREQLLNGTNEG